jgi:hypothetical protein
MNNAIPALTIYAFLTDIGNAANSVVAPLVEQPMNNYIERKSEQWRKETVDLLADNARREKLTLEERIDEDMMLFEKHLGRKLRPYERAWERAERMRNAKRRIR